MDTFNPQPFDDHVARAVWLGAAWHHGDTKTQRVAQMCCWNNIVLDTTRLSDGQRLALLGEFFGVYPVHGPELAKAINTLVTIELFVPNQPLAKAVAPVLTWAEKQGIEVEGVDLVSWDLPRALGLAWQARTVQLRQSLSAQGEGNTYLRQLDNILVAVVALQRDRQDRAGRLALQDVKLIAQRALWDLALDEDSGWGDLLEVALMGFWPRGVTADGRFIVTYKSASV